jgi:hypothetical protein
VYGAYVCRDADLRAYRPAGGAVARELDDGRFRPAGRGYARGVGLLDMLKHAIGAADPPVAPSMAAITIISSDPVTSPSESPSATAKD